jgi:hypothetical protein
MATLNIDDQNAVALRRKAGITITLVNQSATDVYLDRAPDRLNASVTGAVPAGIKLAKTGGQLQWPNFPGVLWFRAATKTSIEVVP